MKAGLVSVSFRSNTPFEIIGAAARSGLSAIEWGSDVHAPCGNSEKLKEIALLQKNAGLECSSYGTYFRIGVTSIGELPLYLTAAEILGTGVLRVWCGDKPSSEYGYDERMKIFEAARCAAETAKAAGMTLCTEFHHHTFTDEALAVKELLEAVDLPSLKTYWQPNQYRTAEENLLTAQILAAFTENVHVFAWHRENRFPLSHDKAYWSKYFSELKASHFALLEFMPDDNIESLAAESEALRELIR